MSPALLLPLAILTPFLLAAVFLLPLYAGFFAAAYAIYWPQAEAAHPLADKSTEVFYILEVYGQLFEYWLQHLASVSFVSYSLPIIGLPLLGGVLALWLTMKLVRRLLSFFHLSAS